MTSMLLWILRDAYEGLQPSLELRKSEEEKYLALYILEMIEFRLFRIL